MFVFLKYKEAYEVRIMYWSSDVCSSDLCGFITGGGSGIGRATAEELIRNGYAAVLVDRNETAGRAAEAQLRQLGDCAFVGCDVTEEKAVSAAVAFTMATYGRLADALNAAGLDEHGREHV